MPFTCASCGQPQQSLIFFCPSCGHRILECWPSEDVIVFRAGNWKVERAVRYKGILIEELTGASLDYKGLQLNGNHGAATIPLFDLYRALLTSSEVLEL